MNCIDQLDVLGDCCFKHPNPNYLRRVPPLYQVVIWNVHEVGIALTTCANHGIMAPCPKLSGIITRPSPWTLIDALRQDRAVAETDAAPQIQRVRSAMGWHFSTSIFHSVTNCYCHNFAHTEERIYKNFKETTLKYFYHPFHCSLRSIGDISNLYHSDCSSICYKRLE